MTIAVRCNHADIRCMPGDDVRSTIISQGIMGLARSLVYHVAISFALSNLHAPPASAQSAAALVDTALARMGGADLTRGVKRVRFELVTQWLRTNPAGGTYADMPSYEMDVDLRDYDLAAWRNTRQFNSGRGITEIVDVVRDTVAIRRSPGGSGGIAAPSVVPAGTWTPLNIAYVDERKEQFATAPERLLLAARSAPDLRLLADTLIDGAPHARLSATVAEWRMTLFVRRSSGFLRAVRFHTAEPNDYGLVPWGEMAVETWYSAWRKLPSGVVYPHEWDVKRVGQLYKRITLVSATINPPAMPDSFAVSDSLRRAYVATATRPMHEIALDSAKQVDAGFVSFNTPGAPAGAVKVGGTWLLLEAGQAPWSAENALAWLAKHEGGARVGGAILSMASTGNGGAALLAKQGVALELALGASPYINAVLRGHSQRASRMDVVTRGGWMRVGGDSLWLEPIDLPDMNGALIAYLPSREWLYSGAAANPLYLDLILERARARGWKVSRLGTARGALMPLPQPERTASTEKR